MTPVPYGLKVSVEFRVEGDTIFVDVHAPMYMRKKWTMDHCYSTEFSEADILRDPAFITALATRYGAWWQ